MGLLQRRAAPRTTFELKSVNLIGRNERCDLQLTEAEISREHALLTWTSDGWLLKDLSSNGTYYGSSRGGPEIPIQAPQLVRKGDLINFGLRCAWEMISAERPRALARPEGGGPAVQEGEERQGLYLPGVRVYIAYGGWIADDGDSQRPILAKDPLLAGGTLWTLELPVPHQATRPLAPRDPPSPQRDLRLSLYQETNGSIRCVIRRQDGEHNLGVFAAYQLLWALAESPGEWVEQKEILQRLQRTDRQNIYNYRLKIREKFREILKMKEDEVDLLVQLENQQLRLNLPASRVSRTVVGAR